MSAFTHTIIAILIFIMSSASMASEVSLLKITNPDNDRWILVHENDDHVEFEYCEGNVPNKNNCEPMYGRTYTRSSLEKQLVKLQQQQDAEFMSSLKFGGVVFVTSFGIGLGISSLSAKLMSTHRLPFGAYKWKILAFSSVIGVSSSVSLSLIHHLLYSPSKELAEALNQVNFNAASDERLVIVEDIDDFMISLNDSLPLY